MNEKIGLLIDSTSLTRPDILSHPFVKVADLKVVLDGTEYEEHELPKEVMLEKLHSTRKMATSQPSPGTFLERYEQFHREGYTHVLVVVLSSAISGTYQSATIAKTMIDFPLEIEVRSPKVASFGVALGVGLLCEAIENHISFSDLLVKYESTFKDATLMFTLSNLMNLFKGGRLGIVSALLGMVLRIKPIIEMNGGKLELAKKERTNNGCFEHFMGKITAFAQTHKTVYIDVITINRADWAQKMVEAIHEAVPHAIVRVTDYLSPVFYVHLGDQGFGFAILGE
ncbi:MAG TPA: DegV family protein [Bacillota bacterium]|nr:DegV family protein [Bacillota bacterium]